MSVFELRVETAMLGSFCLDSDGSHFLTSTDPQIMSMFGPANGCARRTEPKPVSKPVSKKAARAKYLLRRNIFAPSFSSYAQLPAIRAGCAKVRHARFGETPPSMIRVK